MGARYTSYSAFFDFYLSEHERPMTRALHYCGSVCGIAALMLVLTTGNWLWLPVGLVSGYGFAWTGHFFVEHNRPATFKYPLWSFIGDYHMFGLWLLGRLNQRRATAATRLSLVDGD
jgi:hypothetical protein